MTQQPVNNHCRAKARQDNPSRESRRPCRKVILLGHGCLGLSLLKGLLVSDACEIVGVFRWSQRPKGADYLDDYEREFGRLIRNEKLKEIVCPGVNSFEFTKHLQSLNPDVLLIGSWGEILKPHLLKREGLMVVNCHPSKLPQHRGANPYASVIRSGVSETGVTFHLVDEQIDTGPVIMQEKVPILLADTGGSLRSRCADTAERMVPELMALLASKKKLKLIPQDETIQSYFPALKLEDGLIHWNWSPEDIYNQIRGLQPWLDCYTYLNGRHLLTVEAVELRYTEKSKKNPPGTVVAYTEGVVWVSTSEPGTQIGFKKFHFSFIWSFLPCTLSRWLGFFAFRPGVKFCD